MPVSFWMNGVRVRLVLTRLEKVSSTSEPRNLTAPTSMIWSLSGSRPVVSRSSATNVLCSVVDSIAEKSVIVSLEGPSMGQ